MKWFIFAFLLTTIAAFLMSESVFMAGFKAGYNTGMKVNSCQFIAPVKNK